MERIPPPFRIVRKDGEIEPPRDQHKHLNRNEPGNNNIIPTTDLDIASLSVHRHLPEFIHAMFNDGKRNKPTAHHQADAPDPVLVFKEIKTQRRRNSKKKSYTRDHHQRAISCHTHIDEYFDGKLDHRYKRRERGERQTEEENCRKKCLYKRTAGHFLEKLGKKDKSKTCVRTALPGD